MAHGRVYDGRLWGEAWHISQYTLVDVLSARGLSKVAPASDGFLNCCYAELANTRWVATHLYAHRSALCISGGAMPYVICAPFSLTWGWERRVSAAMGDAHLQGL